MKKNAALQLISGSATDLALLWQYPFFFLANAVLFKVVISKIISMFSK
jgi:hypothetical protein